MNAQVNEVRPDEIEGERGLPSVNDRKPSAMRRGLGMLFLLFILAGGLGFAYYWFVKHRQAEDEQPVAKEMQVNRSTPDRSFSLAPPPPDEQPQEVVPNADAAGAKPIGLYGGGAQSGNELVVRPPRLDRSDSDLLFGSASAGGASLAGGASSASGEGDAGTGSPTPVSASLLNAQGGSGGDSGALGGMLSPTSTAMRNAGHLANRNFIIPKGTLIDCVLQTRLDSTVPGMTSCMVTRNVYSDNGKVLLVERGSTVIGEYQSNMRQGMNRIFVLWTRVKTPNGIIVSLDSPGADPLGGAGLPGHVKTHFWKRFGAAMLLSLVDDAASYAVNRDRGSNNQTYYLGSTTSASQEMADKALESTVNIPPTLYKNQGDRVGIYVARDLNFEAVYELRSR